MDSDKKYTYRLMQDRLHDSFDSLFSGRFLTWFDKFFLYPLFSSKRFDQEANIILANYQEIRSIKMFDTQESNFNTYKIGTYLGTNINVNRLRKYLKDHLANYLTGACIHGSLASDEEVQYSDLDASLILNDTAFNDLETFRKIVRMIWQAQYLLHKQDPLQHHGFFILTNDDLAHHTYKRFPPQLFHESRSLLDDQELVLRISMRPEAPEERRESFQRMLNAVKEKFQEKHYPENYFDLKLLLSQLMLLPTLYLQAKGHDVKKAESFLLARKEFREWEWTPIETATRIRSQWQYSSPMWIRFIRRLYRNPFLSTLLEKRFGPTISPDLDVLLNQDFYKRSLILLERMEENIGILR